MLEISTYIRAAMETLDKHFRHLTSAAFARYGFAQAELLRRWPEIVGENLSEVSAPERIKWPRGSAQKIGGTLVIRAAPGHALDIQYEIPRITERINRFHGYEAVTVVKVIQSGSWVRAKPPPAPTPAQKPLFEQDIAQIEDAPLRAALERLGAAVAASSPQDE